MNRNEVYDSVIEMANDIRYMREDISDLKSELRESNISYEKRISDIERIQNLNTGKLATILVIIGAGIGGMVQFSIWIWGKMPK